jgi:hypothetical protein
MVGSKAVHPSGNSHSLPHQIVHTVRNDVLRLEPVPLCAVSRVCVQVPLLMWISIQIVKFTVRPRVIDDEFVAGFYEGALLERSLSGAKIQ